MATITASKLPTVLAPASFKKTTRIHSIPILGLPVMARECKVRCSLEEKKETRSTGKNTSMVLSLMATAASTAGPAMALVDERMSTEGTGLPFGLSNNLLGWILLGVFGLIWSFYTVYTSSLEEDDDSALSL
ncbi:photosystem II reaction center W protein, chloroplastic [Manihot esculenta]|uniref:PSII 6.1 kDa protein n=1 Tax=Manihot esculenta TaxID=3983 RepID=A0A2C9VHA4_MANES|nr:photosystem II reaction center W protein, chloroplastic [Manihot esculenta]OAY44249.1 hypothetical protein MANES_08G135500v8 [Manihot esculenta]